MSACPHLPGWPAQRRLLLAALIAVGLSHVAGRAVAATDAPEPDATSLSPAYRVVIAAPAALEAILERTLGLVRWQAYPDMTDELRDQLIDEAIAMAREAAGAEGYFSATVRATLDSNEKPPLVTLAVEPGEPTRIASVNLTFSGPATTDAPLGTGAIAKARAEWGLPVGAQFRQEAWDAAKRQAVATLAASPYVAARITDSEATIDPEQRQGDLVVAIDSGPPFRFGDLEITGLNRYAPSVVRNFNTIARGTPVSQTELDGLVRRLNVSGYFASVQASIDPETEHVDDAPVRVAVIEGSTRNFEGGLTYSTDVQFGANANYRDVNIDGKATQLYAEARLESKIQAGSLRFVGAPNDAHWIGVASGGVTRTDIEGLVTRTGFAGMRWHTVEERDGLAAQLIFYIDDQMPSGAAATSSHALYAEAERSWRRVDNLVAPTRGWSSVVHAGGGIPGVSTRTFGRVVARYASWHPLARDVELQLRAEGGAVFAPSRIGIPSTLLFRTGGDTTVRGYAYDSLGVTDGNAIVPGRYFALASADLTRWFAPWWGLAAFVDAGNAADEVVDLSPAIGYGVGGRIRTPVGPFRLDLAYGQQSHQVRVHFSVGLSF